MIRVNVLDRSDKQLFSFRCHAIPPEGCIITSNDKRSWKVNRIVLQVNGIHDAMDHLNSCSEVNVHCTDLTGSVYRP
jgi:hypothetical protein